MQFIRSTPWNCTCKYLISSHYSGWKKNNLTLVVIVHNPQTTLNGLLVYWFSFPSLCYNNWFPFFCIINEISPFFVKPCGEDVMVYFLFSLQPYSKIWKYCWEYLKDLYWRFWFQINLIFYQLRSPLKRLSKWNTANKSNLLFNQK